MNAESEPPPDQWDTYWKYFWQLLDPPPLPETWQVVSGCRGVAEILRKFGCKSLLEAASGIGLKAITFQRLGFEVEGLDASAVGIDLAKRLAAAVGVSVPFHRCSWSEIGNEMLVRFDAVFLDQFLQISDPQVLAQAAQCAHHALKEDGIFIFGGMSPDDWKSSPERRTEMRWSQESQRPRIAWTKDNGDTHRTTLQWATRHPRGIYHHFVHLTDKSGERTMEASGFFENHEHTWDELKTFLLAQGFSDVVLEPGQHGDQPFSSGVAIK